MDRHAVDSDRSAATRLSAGAGVLAVIRVGIVGCNYGRTVLVPAFRLDPRCEVVALAGTDAARTAELARAANVPRGVRRLDGAGRAIRRRRGRDCRRRPAGSRRLRCARSTLGKPVFVEKPMAADLAGARRDARPRQQVGRPDDDRFQLSPNCVLAARQGAARPGRDRPAAPRRRSTGMSRTSRRGCGSRTGRPAATTAAARSAISSATASLSRMVLRADRGSRRPRLSGLPDDRRPETNVTLALRFRVRRRRQPADELRVAISAPAIASNSTATTARWCSPTRRPTTCAASS